MLLGDGKRQEIIDAGTIKEIEKDGAISSASILIEKEITENGDYNAKDDGADGYKSVHTDITGDPHFSRVTISVPYNAGTDSNPSIVLRISHLYTSTNGEYTIESDTQAQSVVLCNPAKKIEIGNMLAYTTVSFTPDNDFDGFYVNGSKIVPTGDEIGSKNQADTYYGIITQSGSGKGIKICKKTSEQFVYVFRIQ